MSRAGTSYQRGLLWSMQRRKIKTEGMREQDGAEGRRTQDRNANQIQFFYGRIREGGIIPHLSLSG